MRGQPTPHSVDEVIAAAGGAGSRASLDAANCWAWELDANAIDRRVASGRLLVRSPGRVRRRPPELASRGLVVGGGAGRRRRHRAQPLHAPQRSGTCGSSRPRRSTSACRGGRGDFGWTGGRVHRPRSLPADEIYDPDGLPVTSGGPDPGGPGRGRAGERPRARGRARPRRQSLFDLWRCSAVLAAKPRAAGASRTLRDVIRHCGRPGVSPASEMEDRLPRHLPPGGSCQCRMTNTTSSCSRAATSERRLPLAGPAPGRGDRRLRHTQDQARRSMRDRRRDRRLRRAD